MSHTITFKALWPHQRLIQNSSKRYKFLVTGRRSGKTEILVQSLILKALEKPGTYFWVAPDLKQYRESAQPIFDSYLWEVAHWSGQEGVFHLPNGSHISIKTCESPLSLRGAGLSGCCLDECAHIKANILQECIMPAVKDKNGFVWLASTPLGFNWYYDLFMKVKNNPEWFVMQCPSWVSPLMNKQELEKEIELIGQARWEQEYCGRFVSRGDAIFDPNYFKDIMIKTMPGPFIKSFIAIDSSLGKSLQSDYSAIVFAGAMNDQTIYVDCNMKRRDLNHILHDTKTIWEHYKSNGVVFETNAFQQTMVNDFVHLFKPIAPPTYGFENRIKKEDRISRLATFLARGQIKILDNHGGQLLKNQLMDFPNAEFDDGPDCLEMAVRALYEIR